MNGRFIINNELKCKSELLCHVLREYPNSSVRIIDLWAPRY